MILQGSCSTSVMRIDLTDLREYEIKMLTDLLQSLQDKGEAEHATEDDRNWYDTYFSEQTLFGKRMMKIDGEVPFNSQDWLEEKLASLKFMKEKNVQIEWEE